jgi:non-specific protein-tyrosine kinase
MDNHLEERTTAETVSDYASLLWHWAWLLVLCALLAGGTAYWVSRHLTPIYQASTLVMVDAAPITQTVTTNTLTTSEQLVSTYSKVITTTPVLDKVAERLGLPTFPETAAIQVLPITDTQLMTVIVQDTDPTRAALLAHTLVQVFSDKIQADQAARYADSKKSIEDQLANLEQQIQTTTDALATLANGTLIQAEQDQLQLALTQYRQSYASVLQTYEQIKLAEAQSSSGIIQQEPAVPPDAPIKPRPVLNAGLAAVASLILTTGIIFLIEFLDDTIRDPQEIMRKWGVPVLGTIVRYNHDKDELITVKHPRSQVSEAFRALRTNLQCQRQFAHPLATGNQSLA